MGAIAYIRRGEALASINRNHGQNIGANASPLQFCAGDQGIVLGRNGIVGAAVAWGGVIVESCRGDTGVRPGRSPLCAYL